MVTIFPRTGVTSTVQTVPALVSWNSLKVPVPPPMMMSSSAKFSTCSGNVIVIVKGPTTAPVGPVMTTDGSRVSISILGVTPAPPWLPARSV